MIPICKVLVAPPVADEDGALDELAAPVELAVLAEPTEEAVLDCFDDELHAAATNMRAAKPPNAGLRIDHFMMNPPLR
jgi:hypothetical protein